MIENPLQFVDFFTPDLNPVSGLVPINRANNIDLSIHERTAVFDAESFKHIDFIFFRRFADGRSSQVSAYIIDNTDRKLDEKTLAELHLKVWLQGVAPLLYVAWPSRIDILTCARGPDFCKPNSEESYYNPVKAFELENLRIVRTIDSELQNFSAFSLANGTFWERPVNGDLADHSKIAHQALIQAVVEADKDLNGENNPVMRRLLLLMVLIKYLEDRHVFPNKGWFGKYHKGAKSFFEVLQGGDPNEVYRLLDFLERKFNGDIFSLPQNRQNKLTKDILVRFADLVEARTLSKQRYLWKQFSFEHLPVEVISHLYQHFVRRDHGTIYTPPFLASLLLDHSMPYGKLTGTDRVLDPACGSGVFLVGAFRRLINVWRSQNNWQKPDVGKLKEILKKSIYGVELDPNAVELTAFSLNLAVCDALRPEIIWTDLKFDPLRETNLFTGDFFSMLLNSQHNYYTFVKQKFDVIIGNPPFESKLSPSGKKVNRIVQEKDINRGSLPDKQTAYLFLEQAFTLTRLNGRICLIQPSGFLYNHNARDFKKTILKKYEVNSILDFTSIRKLFGAADPKVIAVFAHANAPKANHLIDHWTFRRTVSVHKRICFELDHYDRHRVPQTEALTDPFVWRANLLGGGRLYNLSKYFRGMRTLEEYIKKEQWDYGEGFIAGTGKKLAPFLTGKPFIPTRAFSDSGIKESEIETVTDKYFESPRSEERFTPPLVLVKENESLPLAFWDKGFIAYRHKIVGIHAPRTQISKLRKLYNYFQQNHEIYKISCALNGSQSLVGKATAILKRDIDLLPYPKNLEELELSFWEKALCEDIQDYIIEYIRLGQNSALLKKAADKASLGKYSSMFLRMLGTIYEGLQASVPIFFNGLICQPFYFGEAPNLIWLTEKKDNGLKKVIYEDRKYEYLRTVRILRFYSENVILLIKPDRLRYWLRSIAIRDADETLIDLRRQGY
jgi:hypothetical protein